MKWISLIILIPMVIMLWGIFEQMIIGKQFGDNPAPDWVLLLGFFMPLLVLIFFFKLTLHTRIDESGIHYRFAPVHRKERHIKWSDVKNIYVRKYKPIAEYGGWGFRMGRSGTALNTSGNMGLQIEFTNGKRLLIGTHKPDELKRILAKRESAQSG